jgi:hypothetical protein
VKRGNPHAMNVASFCLVSRTSHGPMRVQPESVSDALFPDNLV